MVAPTYAVAAASVSSRHESSTLATTSAAGSRPNVIVSEIASSIPPSPLEPRQRATGPSSTSHSIPMP